MDDLTNNTPTQKEAQTPESVVWPTNTDATKKKQKRRILYLVLAILLTISSALGSFYLSRNLNQASTPNAPESQPAAAGKNQTTNNTKAEGCTQGCGSDEYCDNTRCRKIGGNADGRSDGEKAWDSVVVATPTPKGVEPTSGGKGYETIPGYKCSAANCNSGFKCINDNTCINIANPNLSVANDPDNCGGTGNRCGVNQTCVMGGCVSKTSLQTGCPSSCIAPYKCEKSPSDNLFHCIYSDISIAKVTSYVINTTVTQRNDPENCGGSDIKCADGVQKCENGKCVSVNTATKACDGILPDQTYEKGTNTAYSKTCCVPAGTGIGVIPKEAFYNATNPVPEGLKAGDLDTRAHWTNCAAGTTCRQGVGCIGSPTKTPDKTTNEVTTTTTINPTKIPTVTGTPTGTVTVTGTPTGTVTGTPTGTVTVTGTVTATPTIAVCNESCTEDDDCSDGLFCDSESNKCRKPECSDEKDCSCPEVTPEPTIVDCNYKCNSDDNCSSGLICDSDSGRCRKAACSDEKDCSCPKPRKTDAPTREVTTIRNTTRTAAQPTVLKEAGILDFPGAAVFGSGLLLTVIGILLAL